MNRQEEAKEFLEQKFNQMEYSFQLQRKLTVNSIDHTKLISNQIKNMRLFLVIIFILNIFLMDLMFQPIHAKLDFARTFLKDHINIETNKIKNDIKFNCR